MNLGFDLDKVFVNTPPMIPKSVIDRLYKKRDNGTLLYRIPSKPEQIFRRITHLSIFRPAMKENIDFLRSIPKDKNKLYLISSRFKFLENSTKSVIKRLGFDKIFDEMYFNFSNEQPHIFKNRIIKKLKLDYYTDDDLSLLKYVARHNPTATFFWLTPRKHYNPISSNIFALFPLSNLFKKKNFQHLNYDFLEKKETSRNNIKIQVSHSK